MGDPNSFDDDLGSIFEEPEPAPEPAPEPVAERSTGSNLSGLVAEFVPLNRRRVRGGPLYWTPTVEGLWNYDLVIANPEHLDNNCWKFGLESDTIADIAQSIRSPKELLYFDLTPKRKPTLIRKIHQLREAGVVLLIDSPIRPARPI